MGWAEWMNHRGGESARVDQRGPARVSVVWAWSDMPSDHGVFEDALRSLVQTTSDGTDQQEQQQQEEQQRRRRLTLYCGSSRCLAAAARVEGVEATRLLLQDLCADTPAQTWCEDHALQKILHGRRYERQLQIVAQLAAAYKHGGAVLQLGASGAIADGGALARAVGEAASSDGEEGDVWIACADERGSVVNDGGLVAVVAGGRAKDASLGAVMEAFVAALRPPTVSPADAVV